MAQPKIDATGYPHARLQQPRIPGRCVIPHPARRIRLGLDSTDAIGEVRVIDGLVRSILGREPDLATRATDHNVHVTSLPVARDIRRKPAVVGRPGAPINCVMSKIQESRDALLRTPQRTGQWP